MWNVSGSCVTVSVFLLFLRCLKSSQGVFDWAALNHHFASLPSNTAPAGFKCPNCATGLFPQENQAGPVVDALREKLKLVSWARVGLGLPLIEEEAEDANNNGSDTSKTWDAPDSFNPVNVRLHFWSRQLLNYSESNCIAPVNLNAKSNTENYKSNNRIRSNQ